MNGDSISWPRQSKVGPTISLEVVTKRQVLGLLGRKRNALSLLQELKNFFLFFIGMCEGVTPGTWQLLILSAPMDKTESVECHHLKAEDEADSSVGCGQEWRVVCWHHSCC